MLGALHIARGMFTLLKRIGSGLSDFAFPRICGHCGVPLEQGAAYFCTVCRFHSFSRSDRPPDLLPEGLLFMQAMWVFDKGGSLQKALHALKYDSRPDIGLELGRMMAVLMLPEVMESRQLTPEGICLVPVPLHPARQRKRGYNQAERIASGMEQVTRMRVMREPWIRRRRYTRSQTGLDVEARHRNVKDLFLIDRPDRILDGLDGRIPLIVDDVLTTGATVMSLHASLKPLAPASGAIFAASG
jgi:predicted amidophosphoribosyltransferase